MKVQKKPVTVDAILWGGTPESQAEIKQFVNGKTNYVLARSSASLGDGQLELKIATTQGIMTARIGDYIIKGVKGEFYPCKPDIFWDTYSLISE